MADCVTHALLSVFVCVAFGGRDDAYRFDAYRLGFESWEHDFHRNHSTAYQPEGASVAVQVGSVECPPPIVDPEYRDIVPTWTSEPWLQMSIDGQSLVFFGEDIFRNAILHANHKPQDEHARQATIVLTLFDGKYQMGKKTFVARDANASTGKVGGWHSLPITWHDGSGVELRLRFQGEVQKEEKPAKVKGDMQLGVERLGHVEDIGNATSKGGHAEAEDTPEWMTDMDDWEATHYNLGSHGLGGTGALSGGLGGLGGLGSLGGLGGLGGHRGEQPVAEELRHEDSETDLLSSSHVQGEVSLKRERELEEHRERARETQASDDWLSSNTFESLEKDVPRNPANPNPGRLSWESLKNIRLLLKATRKDIDRGATQLLGRPVRASGRGERSLTPHDRQLTTTKVCNVLRDLAPDVERSKFVSDENADLGLYFVCPEDKMLVCYFKKSALHLQFCRDSAQYGTDAAHGNSWLREDGSFKIPLDAWLKFTRVRGTLTRDFTGLEGGELVFEELPMGSRELPSQHAYYVQ